MPTVELNGTSIYYEDTGGNGPPILFSHGLLWNTRLFDPQVAALKSRYRCVAYDHRGQGRSAVGTMSTIDMDTLTDDAVALIDKLGLGAVHFCGLSMGGFIGMRIATRHPTRLHSLILCETSSDPEPEENAPKYRLMNFIGRWVGVWAVTGSVMPVMFGKSTLADPARKVEIAEWRRIMSGNRRDIWRAVNGVLDRPGLHHELGEVGAPTLIIVGEEDVATVPAKAERMAAAIAGSKLVRIPGAGHSSTVEQPAAVTAAIAAFLDAAGRAARQTPGAAQQSAG